MRQEQQPGLRLQPSARKKKKKESKKEKERQGIPPVTPISERIKGNNGCVLSPSSSLGILSFAAF